MTSMVLKSRQYLGSKQKKDFYFFYFFYFSSCTFIAWQLGGSNCDTSAQQHLGVA